MRTTEQIYYDITREELLEEVFKEMRADILKGDHTAIEELLRNVTNNELESYLPEKEALAEPIKKETHVPFL